MVINQTRPENLINILAENGEISMSNGKEELFIESIDDKEGYSYVSSTNKEFGSSKTAIVWAIKRMNGIDNITNWN